MEPVKRNKLNGPSKVIRVSLETFNLMQLMAEPFVDIPDSVVKKAIKFYLDHHPK